MKLTTYFQQFYLNYPFLSLDKLIDYFSIFGGLDDYSCINLHNATLRDALDEVVKNCNLNLPFFATQEPFRKFLIKLAIGDGKIDSTLNKALIGHSFGEELINELIEANILYIVNSREKPLKSYKKELIKKELRGYHIQNKLRFTKPIYKFWFGFVEPLKDKYENIDINLLYNRVQKFKNSLTYLVFEQLSRELLKIHLQNSSLNCSSYWDRFSEFDIYCQDSQSRGVVGECKYTSRPVTKAELIKLYSKIEQSNLNIDKVALFSKSGFSSELKKSKNSKLLLFELEDYRVLLNTLR